MSCSSLASLYRFIFSTETTNMHTIPFILGAIASGLGSALALPLPRPDLLPTTSPNVQTLSKRDPTPAGNSCSYDISPAYQWEVYIHNESQYEQNPHHDNCGGGFLDNFRGRCGVITTWTCTYVNPSVPLLIAISSIFLPFSDGPY